jgi:hypothetical protein
LRVPGPPDNQTAYVERPPESGPYQAAEDAARVECDLLVRGFDELADALGWPSARFRQPCAD